MRKDIFIGAICGVLCAGLCFMAAIFGYCKGQDDLRFYLTEQSMFNSQGEGEATFMTDNLSSAYENGYWQGYIDCSEGNGFLDTKTDPYRGVIFQKD